MLAFVPEGRGGDEDRSEEQSKSGLYQGLFRIHEKVKLVKMGFR